MTDRDILTSTEMTMTWESRSRSCQSSRFVIREKAYCFAYPLLSGATSFESYLDSGLFWKDSCFSKECAPSDFQGPFRVGMCQHSCHRQGRGPMRSASGHRTLAFYQLSGHQGSNSITESNSKPEKALGCKEQKPSLIT